MIPETRTRLPVAGVPSLNSPWWVGAAERPASRHLVPFGYQVFDLHADGGERGQRLGVEPPKLVF